MLGSHKRLLTIVLTVVSLLAMLAPAAIAAPEVLHGVDITAPVNGDPAYIDWKYLYDPEDGIDYLTVEYDVLTAQMQVCDVELFFSIFNQNGYPVGAPVPVKIGYADLQDAVNSFEVDLPVAWLQDGWYDLKVVGHEVGWWPPLEPPNENYKCYENVWWEDVEEMAFLVDRMAPTARLLRPADDHWLGATFVTGKAFQLVGTADDKWGVKGAWFELCPEGPWACMKKWMAGDWLAIGEDIPALPTVGIPGQFETTWDSTTVTDGFYFIRICAEDVAGNSNCWDSRVDLPLGDEATGFLNPWPDAHWVYVNNMVEIPLQVGWNLISTPLLPYDTDIEDVLFHLMAHPEFDHPQTVEAVWTYDAARPVGQQWLHWTPETTGAADTLDEIVDGRGYWIKMKARDVLTIYGTWTTIGDGETPPAYSVVDGWNMIGYTHWGRPTIWPTDKVSDYLGAGLIDNLQALFYYDPWTNVWVKLYAPHNMVLGKGYWLATLESGVIRF